MAASMSCLPSRLVACVCFSMLVLLSLMGISCYHSGMKSLTMLASVQSFCLQFKGVVNNDVFQRQDNKRQAVAVALEGSESRLLNSSNAAAAAAAAVLGDDQVSSLATTTSFGSPEQPKSSSTRRSRNKNRRLLYGKACTYKDISISQSREGSSGMPQFNVQIVNTCLANCAPMEIHVSCGWFASAPLVNPNVFKRVAFDDCLVNGGKPLKHGDIIRFEYSNSFMYPLRFRSAKFC